MNLTLRPGRREFVERQVKAGHYGTVEDAVNAVIARAKVEEELLSEGLSDEDLRAIEEGLGQLDRGETRSWEAVRAELIARCGKP